ncbi:hypothetical protein [Micromonospora sp. NPDC092111]|uniref:hypothetical protein n=1 Tax=Micromonospora sp. NPDC092111 TaxID=3364289 RepID=UPI003813C5C1
MTPLAARSTHEAHLYMDLQPCGCGAGRFPRAASVVALPDGDLARRYAGACERCGTGREFLFRLPAEPVGVEEGFRYGGAEQSLLIDAGEWLWVAEGHARGVPAGAAGLPAADRRRCEIRLTAAVAALDEVLKFVPPGGSRVPFTAVWTALGRSVYQREPGRFRTGRLTAVRSAYAGALRRLG